MCNLDCLICRQVVQDHLSKKYQLSRSSRRLNKKLGNLNLRVQKNKVEVAANNFLGEHKTKIHIAAESLRWISNFAILFFLS